MNQTKPCSTCTWPMFLTRTEGEPPLLTGLWVCMNPEHPEAVWAVLDPEAVDDRA